MRFLLPVYRRQTTSETSSLHYHDPSLLFIGRSICEIGCILLTLFTISYIFTYGQKITLSEQVREGCEESRHKNKYHILTRSTFISFNPTLCSK